MRTQTVPTNEHGEPIGESILDAIEVAPPRALEALNRSEIDMQVATAKKFPRSIGAALMEVQSLATQDEATAQACFYRLPPRKGDRENKWIEGESIRFAEIVLCAWGNIRHGVRIIDVGERFIIAQATVFDVEKNSLHCGEVQRQIVGKHGRYSDNMIQVTGMAASSIALRNAVFRVIPKGLFRRTLDAIHETALGKGKTMEQRRADAVKHFNGLGVTTPRILARMERRSIDDLTLEDLTNLRGLAAAIKDKQIGLDEAFAIDDDAKQAESGQSRAMSAIAEAKAKLPPAAAQTESATAKAETASAAATSDADDWEDHKAKGGK